MRNSIFIIMIFVILLLQVMGYANSSGAQIQLENQMNLLIHENKMLKQQIEIITDNIPTLRQVIPMYKTT